MTKKLKCAVFISDEGFGHMVRQRAIVLNLKEIPIDKVHIYFKKFFILRKI